MALLVFSPVNLVMIEEDELSDVTVHGEDIGPSATPENQTFRQKQRALSILKV